MQHKRKTNHERFEEDCNKLAIGYRLSAIGYRLSAIGYRLILGVLVSVCLLNTQDAHAQTDTYGIKNCSITVQGSVYQSDEFCGEKKSKKQALRTIIKLPIGSFSFERNEDNKVWTECKANSLCAVFTKVDGKSNSFLCSVNENGLSINTHTIENQNRLVQAITEAESRCASGSSASQTNESQQRQGRQMCEAQKQTCLTACPSLRYSDGTWRRGNEASTCMASCQSINCN